MKAPTPHGELFLALETATPVASVAVGSGDLILCGVHLGVRSRHSESLLPMVDFAMSRAGVRPADLAGVVIGAGPGSFTGLRVAAATAKAICRVADLPLLAWPTPLAVALSAGTAGPVAVWLESRRGEVYAACYDVQRESVDARVLLEPQLLPVTEALRVCGVYQPFFSGEAATANAAMIEEAGHRVLVGATEPARALLRLALARPSAGRVAEPSGWEPAYLQPSPAERARQP
jgi:tRNA threonylcarbamoyladenosine biosynthesis protein TsaB